MSETVADILERAANHIDRVGLHKGTFCDRVQRQSGTPLLECRVCAYGAINVATTGHPSFPPMMGSAGGYATEALVSFLGGSIIRWNDAPDRTQEEVVSTLRAAAQRARQ